MMSRDRVTFFLPKRYYQTGQRASNGFSLSTMQRILLRSFGMQHGESYKLMNANPRGFTITCRPSQFARFIVYRCDVDEGINGIRDLTPEIHAERSTDIYTIVAKAQLVSRETVKMIGDALGFLPLNLAPKDCVDVSKRDHVECD